MRRVLLPLLLLSTSAWGQITFDTAQATGQFYQKSPFTWPHTMTSGTSCVLIAFVARYSHAPTVTGMTYGGVASSGSGTLKSGDPGIQYFYWLNPPAGTATISGTMSNVSDTAQMAVSRSYCGVSQVTPIDATAGAGPVTTVSPGISITPAHAGAWAVDVIFAPNGSGWFSCTGSWGHCVGNQNSNTILSSDIGPINPAAQVTSAWGSNNQNWISGAIALMPDTQCQITTATLPMGAVGVAYSQTFATTNCPSPAFSVTAGSLPPGLSLNTGTGAISGTPTTSIGSPYNFTIGASSANGTGSRNYSVTMLGAACAVATASLPGGAVGMAYSQTVATTDCPSPAFSVSAGALPGGLVLNSATGVISGFPTTATGSPFSFTISVASANGGASNALGIAIVDSPLTISNFSIVANSPTSALATWTTSIPASSKVQCGTNPAGPYTTYATPEVYHDATGPGAGVTSHRMVITGLPNNTSGTAYYCQAMTRTTTSAFITSGIVATGTLAAMPSTPISAQLSPYSRYNDQYSSSGKACNMDTLYANAWADDGNVYMPGDDTSGCTASGGSYAWFGSGSNIAVYSLTPAALTTITPTNRMTNFGGAGAANSNGWNDGATWKSGTIISFHGNLLRAVHRQGGTPLLLNPSLVISADHGATWLAPENYPNGTPQANGDPPTGGHAMWSSNARCGSIRMAQHAQDYGGASGQFPFTNYGNADGWVYGVCIQNNADGGATYLFRVRVEDILLLDAAKYQYYMSGDGLLDTAWTTNLNSAGAILSGYESFGVGFDFIPDFNRWIFVARRAWAPQADTGILILDAAYPWSTPTIVGLSARDNAHVNYLPAFPSVMISTYTKTSESPLAGAVTIMTTGGDPGATTSSPATDEYGPHWFQIVMTERTGSRGRPLPQSYAGGKNVHISHGLDLWYPMQPLGEITDKVKDHATGKYTVAGLGNRPQYDARGMVDFGFWSGFVATCSPACALPSAYTLTTPYTATLGDFTLAIVFAHYPHGGTPALGPNILAINNNETVLDKTTAGVGLRIFRNGAAANSWKVTVGNATSSAFSLPTDQPAGAGNFPLLFVRRMGSVVTVYRATGLTGLPLTALTSFSDSNATDGSALLLGSAAGGTQAFYGTVSHLQIWKRALNDWEMVIQAGTIKTAMEPRGLTVQ